MTLKKNLCSFICLSLIGITLIIPPTSTAAFTGVLPVPPAAQTPVITLNTNKLLVGETATVTFTFPAVPTSFSLSDIQADNGVISNLTVTADVRVYTATFTPTDGIADTSNTISVNLAPYVKVDTYPIEAGTNPISLAFDGTSMWIGNGNTQRISKISQLGDLTSYTTAEANPYGLAFDGTNMWAIHNGSGRITIIDSNGTTVENLKPPSFPSIIAFDGSNMWTGNTSNHSVSIINPSKASTTYSLTPAINPYNFAFDGTDMWSTNPESNSVAKTTPLGVTTEYVLVDGTGPYGIAFDGTDMWTANYIDDTVTKVDQNGAMTTFQLPNGSTPFSIAFDGTNMWTANYSNDTVSMITATGTITSYSLPSGSSPYAIAFDGTSMWTVNNGNENVSKITRITTTPSANYEIDTTTPIVATSTPSKGSKSSATRVGVRANAIPTASIPSTPTAAASSTCSRPPITRNLSLGAEGADVRQLQQLLNCHGFTVATLGAGSKGQETTYFGTLTKQAVIKFQEAHASTILTPVGLTSGSGIFGAMSRAFATIF